MSSISYLTHLFLCLWHPGLPSPCVTFPTNNVWVMWWAMQKTISNFYTEEAAATEESQKSPQEEGEKPQGLYKDCIPTFAQPKFLHLWCPSVTDIWGCFLSCLIVRSRVAVLSPALFLGFNVAIPTLIVYIVLVRAMLWRRSSSTHPFGIALRCLDLEQEEELYSNFSILG